jgi:all-trans-retinol 13,14-reductase
VTNAQKDFDDLIIGSGMAGLSLGALLAHKGRRVGIFEAHDKCGGYAHTFTMGQFNFCAQVHYIFGCGEGENIHRLLTRLGLEEKITFHRLDPEGFDHVVVAGDRHRICNGLVKYRDRLIRRYPDAEKSLRRYFDVLRNARDELDQFPDRIGLKDLATAPLKFRTLLRTRNHTLQHLFDEVRMPKRLQAVLAGQAGDYLLPPEEVSFLLHVALVANYDRGAYYPVRHFSSLVDELADVVGTASGSSLFLEKPVASIECHGKRALAVRTADGGRFTAERIISNADPQLTYGMLQGVRFAPRKKAPNYEYSSSNFTLYLGVKNLDLRDHGFGNHNVWHYPHDDLNRMYRVQKEENNLEDPWLFLSTPTLHSDAPGLCPPGNQILEVATSCSFTYFADLWKKDRKAYTRAKVKIRDRILDVIQENYLPGLRQNLSMKVAGTPRTNERYVRAPRGNAYGANLTPENMFPRVRNETPVDNLYLVNATAGYPSVGGTVGAALKLFEKLSGERV